MQTEATRSSHGTSDTLVAEKSKLELELEDAVENGFELRKGIGLRFQRAHAPITARHAEYKALKSHQHKAQCNMKQKKTLPKLPRRGPGVGRVRVFRCDGGEVRLLLRPQGRDPTHKCLRWNVRQDGRFMGVMESHYQRKRILLFVMAARNGLCRKKGFALGRIPRVVSFSIKSQRTTVDHNETLPQQPLENAVPSKSKSEAKATYTQCLPRHTRVLHMRAVVHGPRVCSCRF